MYSRKSFIAETELSLKISNTLEGREDSTCDNQ